MIKVSASPNHKNDSGRFFAKMSKPLSAKLTQSLRAWPVITIALSAFVLN